MKILNTGTYTAEKMWAFFSHSTWPPQSWPAHSLVSHKYRQNDLFCLCFLFLSSLVFWKKFLQVRHLGSLALLQSQFRFLGYYPFKLRFFFSLYFLVWGQTL
jgi:hypothetical protein